MKVNYFDNENGFEITLTPETTEEMATLARISLNRLAEPADITLFVNCKEPYAAFWIKKVHKSAQKNYISKK